MPGGPGHIRALRAYVSSFLSGTPQHYLGHNPVARIGVTLMLLLLLIQVVTGIVLAGTDLFYPPFGHWIAQWVAASGVDPATLVPYVKDTMDPVAYEQMRSFRKPFITTHEYSFYVLSTVIAIHVAAVVISEFREGGSLVSAMFTGRKIIAGKPEDVRSSNRD
ncbi:MAG: cytochrome b/b6 domain-containing protein [Gammaproteobacteria bacterium]|nr:cytochrome b/b6 domain-containing protein [Gammaproteobacteria bacterium]